MEFLYACSYRAHMELRHRMHMRIHPKEDKWNSQGKTLVMTATGKAVVDTWVSDLQSDLSKIQDTERCASV